MASNVHKLRPSVSPFTYADKLANAEAAMQVIRDEMYLHDIHAMSRSIDVSVTALYAVRAGRTSWPRPKTFFGLINYLGLEMHLVKR